MVGFDQGDAGCAARAADDGGVAAGIEVDQQRGFQFVGRRQPVASMALCCDSSNCHPWHRVSGVEEVERWIEQRILNSRADQGRTDRTKENRGRIDTRDDYAPNHDAVVRPDETARANVREPRTRCCTS